jgi:Phage head maturation protease
MTVVLCDSETVNSYGFKTDVKGIDLTRFEKNPVMLYNHDPEKVIGRWENISVTDTLTGHTILIAEPVFDTDDPFAAEIERKVNEGFIKGCSMGMMVKEVSRIDGVDIATKSVLLEASIVSIPADENALVVYADETKKQKLSINEFNKLFYNMENQEIELSQRNVELQAQIDQKDEQIKALTTQIDQLKCELAERDYHEAEAFVDKAIADGKITGEVKDEAMSFYLSFPKETEKLFGAIKAQSGTEGVETPTQSLSAQINTAAPIAQTWDELDHIPGALRKLKDENIEEFKRLYRDKFHCEWTRF